MRAFGGYLFVILMAVACIACSSKSHTPTTSENWPAMDDFHWLIAETFHPYKDSGNLIVAKASATDLALAAEKWANSPLPSRVNTEKMKAGLQQLVNEATTLARLVRNGKDEEIGESLVRLHNLFHQLQENWNKKNGNEDLL